MLAHALDYAAAGFYVFPVDGKRPHAILGNAGGYHHATLDPAQISAWWGTAPDAGIGIALAPSRLVCLDVDVSDGKPGMASLSALAASVPEIDACSLVARTGSGGLHLLWRATDDIARTRRAAYRPGLDLLSDGYIVAAPSPHASGGRYAWLKTDAVTDAPIALRAALASRERPARDPGKPDGAPASLGKIKPGSRNADMFRFAASLRNQGLGATAVLAACLAENAERFDPPLDDTEVHEVCGKALRSAKVERDALGGEAFREEILARIASPLAEVPTWITPDVIARLQAIFDPPTDPPVAPLDASILDTARAPVAPVAVIATKYPGLNASLGGGLRSSSMTVLAGPPGQGKSAFALDLAIDAITREPASAREVVVFSTELSGWQIVCRTAAHVLGDRAWRDLEAGALPQAQVADVLERAGLGRLRIVGADTMPRDGGHVLRALVLTLCESITRTGTRPLVVLDYMQHLARGADDQARARVGDVSGKLRAITAALDCFLIAVSSVSRASYSAAAKAQAGAITDPAHYLTVIKESGDVEYDAASVLYLEVAAYEEGQATRPARIAVAKARTGPPVFVGATFHGASGRWAHAPESLFAVTAEAQREKRTNAAHAEADARTLERIRRLYDAGNMVALSSKNKIVESEGGTKAVIHAAIDRLVTAGKIALVPRRYVDNQGVTMIGDLYVPAVSIDP